MLAFVAERCRGIEQICWPGSGRWVGWERAPASVACVSSRQSLNRGAYLRVVFVMALEHCAVATKMPKRTNFALVGDKFMLNGTHRPLPQRDGVTGLTRVNEL